MGWTNAGVASVAERPKYPWPHRGAQLAPERHSRLSNVHNRDLIQTKPRCEYFLLPETKPALSKLLMCLFII